MFDTLALETKMSELPSREVQKNAFKCLWHLIAFYRCSRAPLHKADIICSYTTEN
jgi:hypothetical protein